MTCLADRDVKKTWRDCYCKKNQNGKNSGMKLGKRNHYLQGVIRAVGQGNLM